MKHNISKRADLINSFGNAVLSLWNPKKGPFGNVLGLGSGVLALIPGVGMYLWLFNAVADIAGYGLGDLGEWIDGELGYGPRSEVTFMDAVKVVERLFQVLTVDRSTAAYNSRDPFTKLAVIKLLTPGVAKFVAKLIWKMFKFIMVSLAVNKVSDIYSKAEERVTGGKGNLLQQVIQNRQTAPEIPTGTTNVKNKEEDPSFNFGEFKKMLTDPTVPTKMMMESLKSTMGETNMDWNKSETMREFLKIAENKELLKGAAPSPNPHQEDKKVIEEKKPKSGEKNIIDEAHPESVYTAEARGDGGLVENANEQQKKLIEMINKMPTGSLVGRYASIANELIKMANKCDEVGEVETADALTETAGKLLELMADLPFDEAPGK